MNIALFGTSENPGAYTSAQKGILVIDEIQIVSMHMYNKIIDRVEQESEKGFMTGNIPQVNRPLEERKALIQKFLAIESVCTHRTIVISEIARYLDCFYLGIKSTQN